MSDPVPIHQQTLYTQELGYDVRLPETEKAAAEVLSLPVHPALSQADLATIVSAMNECTTAWHTLDLPGLSGFARSSDI